MPRIQLLPPQVFSRIAAGEVVERPAALLKELVENALDAGATRISIESSGAGRKTLRVSDDGCGMDPKDCELALERHATSKIASVEDLEKLSTFGFRGEALFAAAAVSRLSIVSCPEGARSGWKVEAEAGLVKSSGPAPAAAGTTVEARDLFFNTPARLKFLKSDAFEKSRLAAVVEEAALAHPEVQFLYKSEGRLHLRFDPENERARLAAVLGDDAGRNLLLVEADRPGFKARFYVSAPDGLVATRELQHWFVNRRPVEAKTLQQALYRAYGEHRPKDRHPACVGCLEMPPDCFDVNVHPGKREVRFRSEREVFELVYSLISNALLKNRSAAPIVAEPRPLYSSSAAPARAEQASLLLESAPAEAFEAGEGRPAWFTPPFRYLGQIERSYLVFEAAGGLFVLDQHAAAERILFEKLLGEVESGRVRSQRLMLPLAVELPASSAAKVLGRKERLERLGFEIAPFGKTGLHVLAAPARLCSGAPLQELVHRLLESLEDEVSAAQAVQHDMLATVACKAAVKAHDALGEKEALRLLEDLKDCRDGSCCPHGRRAMLALNREELARRFQRPGAPPL